MRVFLSFTLLAVAAVVQAAEPPSPEIAALVAQRQAPAPPQAPPVAETSTYSLVVISRSDCPPCAKLKAELDANGQGDDFPGGKIYTDRPDIEDEYHGVTAYPTIILTIGYGSEVARHVGYLSAEQIKAWIADPKKPIAEGENAVGPVAELRGGRGDGFLGSAIAPNYRPIMQPMRFYQGRACST